MTAERAMMIADILLDKGTETIRPTATLREAVRELADHNVGALVVCDGDDGSGKQVLGVISEREIVYAQARGGLDQQRVCDAMATDVPVVSPSDSAHYAMQLMTDRRTRYLLVFDHGEFQAIISIVDLLQARYRELACGDSWAVARRKPR